MLQCFWWENHLRFFRICCPPAPRASVPTCPMCCLQGEVCLFQGSEPRTLLMGEEMPVNVGFRGFACSLRKVISLRKDTSKIRTSTKPCCSPRGVQTQSGSQQHTQSPLVHLTPGSWVLLRSSGTGRGDRQLLTVICDGHIFGRWERTVSQRWATAQPTRQHRDQRRP